jgi:GT2 family glycosyltransferase
MKLSVVIACYNGASFIGTQLEALANQSHTGPWELIVSDNGSTDRSVSIVQEYAKHMGNVRVVDSSDKQSRAHARNVGVSVASGDAILFLDQDDQADRDYLTAMSKALSKYDFVAGRLETTKLNEQWVQKGRGFHPQTRGLIRYWYPPFFPHAAGCTLGVKRDLFDLVGGLDEGYVSLDDTDFCFKVQLKGVPLQFVPDAVVHYRFRHTLAELFRQAQEYSEENVKIYKEYRHRGMPELTLKQALPLWKKLIKTSVGIRDRGDLAFWLWQFGWRLGRVKGSVKHRILAI